MQSLAAAAWAALDDHFQCHVKLVDRFREAGPEAVTRMWEHQSNEHGQGLSRFEREALIERYCELFGTWPDLNVRHGHGPSAGKLERAKLCIAEGKQRVADQRRRIAERERLGGDTQLSKRLLATLETSLRLMIGYGDAIERMANGIDPDCHLLMDGSTTPRSERQLLVAVQASE